MKIIPLVRSEFARLTASRLGIASLIAIMIVPIVYGGLYLWGNKDPYGNLKNVPAALVVADAGTTVGGKPVNYGKDAGAQLLEDHAFDWKRVSASAAAAGVRKGTYDFAVTFPTAFSRDLASAGGPSPTKATIGLRTDDTNSYLSTTIAKQATESVRVAIAEKVGKAGSRELLDAVSSVRSGLVSAQDGASQLASGAASAASGAATVSSGAAKVADGAASLAAGVPAAASGSAQLSAGLSTLSAGFPQYRSALAQALAASGLPAANQQQLLAGLDQLAAGASLSKTKSAELASALAALPANADQLSSGASHVAAGASSLSSGVAALNTGASQLSGSLTSGVAKVPATTAAERAAKAAQLANPATVTQHAVTTAQNYGAGLAPFFISLSAWIGLYALFLLVRPLSRRALTAVRRPIRTTIAGWLTPAVLGVVQMVALFAVVTLALHLQVADGAGMLAFMALTAITFAAMILALNVLFGSVGQFLALILMIVQLVTAGGTFPWQTLPGPLAVIHQALPMAHAVDGIRALMYGGDTSTIWGPVTFLLYWLVGSLLVALLGATRQARFRTLVQLRPGAIGG